MNTKYFKTLEYDKIIDKLTAKAISSMGKTMARALLPATDKYEIQKNQSLTAAAYTMIIKKGSLPLGGIKDISPSLERALKGGMLNIAELLHIGDFIYVCRKVKNYSKAENKDDVYPLLDTYFESIKIPASLEKKLSGAIQNENELKDEASSGLRSIRRSIKSANSAIRDQLSNIISSGQYKNMLQEPVVTLRSGRYCVPIKQEHKNAFPGIIHDQSSTGATVFMEPMGVVNQNNKIKELLSKEKEEVDKILAELSVLVAQEGDLLRENADNLTYLDFLFAKGGLALAMDAVEPDFEQLHIDIKKARHPLIDPEKIVPLDIYYKEGIQTLLITGPNTGGKTVALKTLGLFVLMAQAGLHLPAQNCSLTVFDNVFADIGDEQSIEQSLSTFSGHMTNIVKILEQATENSLVILDELGAGTDPTEGAALAIGILDYLHDKNIKAAVTTHYSELKVYALSKEGIENASCEFDINTLAPTYRLLIGIPGKSNAFAISQKLGLSSEIISAAKKHVSNQDLKMEDILSSLEMNRKTASMEEERAKAYRREAEALKLELDNAKTKLEAQKEKILKKAKEEAAEKLRLAEETAAGIIREMQKEMQMSVKSGQTIEEARKLAKTLSMEREKLNPELKIEPPKNLKLGDTVYIHTLNQKGIVAALPDSTGQVMVKAGIMKIKVPINRLSLDTEETVKVSPTIRSGLKVQKAAAISTELDLRGQMPEEALNSTSKYLDDAYLSGLKQATIIHGKGSGVLRKAVQDYLKKNPYVKSYRIGEFNEGDSGVTIVEMK